MLNTWGFWLRWSWRDLRERWVQVIAVALIIALGTAIYVGLGSTTPWRQQSAEASYDLLNMYDLRVMLATGTFAEQDQLLHSVQAIPHAAWITGVEPRLITDTLVNVPTPERDILVRGKLYGLDVAQNGPHINGVYAEVGRPLTSADAGQPVALPE